MKIHGVWENENIETLAEQGMFSVLNYKVDRSLDNAAQAIQSYFMSAMHVCRRQPVATLDGSKGLILSPGALQFHVGKIKCITNVKGVGDLMKKAVSAKVTGEGAIKPKYTGTGVVFLEPSYKHFLLLDVAAFGNVVISDGMFIACEDTVDLTVTMVKSMSGAMLGGEGLFNLCLRGSGIALVECEVPHSELIMVELHNEELKVDGPYAVMWDDELTMTVERSSKTLLGSAVNGEGLLNVYRGTGRVWLSCVASPVTKHF